MQYITIDIAKSCMIVTNSFERTKMYSWSPFIIFDRSSILHVVNKIG